MRAPLRAGASTTTVASLRPLMMRLRRGNVPWLGLTSGASSDTTAPPPAMIAAASRACDRGATTAWPPPMTATVVPPARTVASCADAVDPEGQPRHDRGVGGDQGRRDPAGGRAARRRRATRPDDRHGPLPAQSAAGSPVTNSTCGGMAIEARRDG